MRRRCAAWAVAALPLLCGCDFSLSLSFVSGDFEFPPESAVVSSDPATDGDVRRDGAVETADVILAGVDPLAPPPALEYRGFLSFPIGFIPAGAWVESATVTATVDRIDPSGAGLALSFDRVRYGGALSAAAFDVPGASVASFTVTGPQFVTFGVVPELQAEVNDPAARFFQLRARVVGGLARIVDGAGNRAGGLPPDRSLAPVLSVTWRP